MSKPGTYLGEITLIGTGGGYGESIVIHLGDDNWAVIDSCVNPKTKESLPLMYLKSIGVNVANDVKIIVCTHWHDDHILGISQLLDECTSSKFCIARAHDLKKFLQFVTLDYEKVNIEVSNSSTVEFNKCLEIINQRSDTIILAHSDRTILSKQIGTTRCEVLSLSPSDYTICEFDKEISALITEYGSPAKKILTRSPNSKSVAIFLRLGEHRAILGADLEETQNMNEGWTCIVNNSQVIDRRSSFFKIPHHGSENGYCSGVWNLLLQETPIATLTPWNKNKKLPQEDMLRRYSQHTSELYMTSEAQSNKPKKREKRVEKIIKDLSIKIREVKFHQGLVRCRIDLFDSGANWQVEVLENAKKIEIR